MKKTAMAAILLVATSASSLSAGYEDLNAAISYRNQGQYDDAIIWFTKAIQDGDLTPDQTRIAYLDRGLSYATMKDTKNAIADYSAAIAAQPDDLLPYENRAATYIALGNFEMAYADYGTLLKLRPHDYSTRMIFGWMSWQLGQFQSAADAFYYFEKTKTEAWLWLQLANVRLGKPVDDFTDASSALGLSVMRANKIWPRPMARFFQGNLSEADALGAAPENDVCAAHIYAGLWRLVHNDHAGAETLLKVAENKCGKDGEYWRIADAELAKLSAENSK
jgi:tetratricopeptide (TPR) repeat protein